MDADFRRVVEKFKTEAELSAEELQYFQFSTLSDVLSILGAIQEKQAKTKRLAFLRRIDPFLKTMTEYGKVIEVFLNVSEFLAFIWGPLKFLLQVTSNFSDAFDSLLCTYQQIGEQVPLLESYQSLFSENAYMRPLLVMIYEDITSFHIMAIRYFRQSTWKQFVKSNWKGFTAQISLLKDNLRRHKTLIENRASIIEFEAIQQLRISAQKGFHEMKEAETSRKKAAVVRWLAPVPVEEIHERHLNAKLSDPQSCRWIFDDSRFQRWFDPLYCSTPLLWINGKPGAGKSVLASTIIEEAKKHNDVSICFFYCGFDDPERSSYLPIARSLLSQLLVQNGSLLLLFEEKMSSSGQVILSSSELAKDLLKTALRSRKTFIILDGIDECSRDQRKEICQWFKLVVDSLPRTQQDEIRCLFISQDDGIGRKDLSMLPTISLKPDQNKADIERFCRGWQDRIENKFGSLTYDGLDITDTINARSQGVFMFAKCVLEELYQQPSRADLLREWGSDRFPTDLDETYDRILMRVLNGKVKARNDISKKLLSWISLSKRPLRWFEIQAAMSIDLDNGTINEENRRLLDSCKDLCASFVEVHADQSVELVHKTVKQFLETRDVIQTARVELDLCLSSLAYLNYPEIDPTQNSQVTKEALITGRYSFYEYAVAYWVHHLISYLSDKDRDENKITELQETIEQFLDQHYLLDAPIVTISKQIDDKLQPLKNFHCYESLAQAVMWSRKQVLAEGDSDEKAVLNFPEITSKMREALEGIVGEGTTPEITASLELYAGDKWFKCPKIYCRHFYDGFTSRGDRDNHVNRHIRSFVCTFEGCLTATIGCLSKRDLRKHMRQSHGISEDEDEFPDIPNPNPGYNRINPATFQCTLCPKRFTRAYNLRSHIRTHTDERPFVCTVCGRAFSRQHDRKEHERLHSGERTFVCRGDLSAGGKWGCGARYSRQSALARHFRTNIGRSCIQPLLEEELASRRKAQTDHGLAQGLDLTPSDTERMDVDTVSSSAENGTQPSYHHLPATQQDQGFIFNPLDSIDTEYHENHTETPGDLSLLETPSWLLQ